jgi:hypothetical protein
MVEVSTVTLAQVFRARPPVMNGGLLHRTRRNLHLVSLGVVGDPARANIFAVLMDGRTLTTSGSAS